MMLSHHERTTRPRKDAMSKKTPPPKKQAPASAPTTATEAPAQAPVEWTDVSIAVQVEVAKDGSLLCPFEKRPIARAVDGVLDVCRPSLKDMPRPDGVKASPTVGIAFAEWYLTTCYGTPVTAEVAAERFGIKDLDFPGIEVDPKDSPFAVVTAKLGDKEFAFVMLNNQIARVGLRTEKSYLWAWPADHEELRGRPSPRSTRCESAVDAFKVMMSSFTGKFALGGEPKPEKAAPKAKAAPTKTAPPKKVPAKK